MNAGQKALVPAKEIYAVTGIRNLMYDVSMKNGTWARNNKYMNRLLKAISIASIAHKDQRRKGDKGAPYINHLIEVTSLLSDVAGVTDEDVLIGAILHDLLEDTSFSSSRLRKEFGDQVVNYVEWVTDDKNLTLSDRRQLQLEHIDDAPDEVKLIKLADHCSNVSSIPPKWDRERAMEYIEWSFSVATKCFCVSKKLEKIYLSRYADSKNAIFSRDSLNM